jgi:hypothetical protein
LEQPLAAHATESASTQPVAAISKRFIVLLSFDATCAEAERQPSRK